MRQSKKNQFLIYFLSITIVAIFSLSFVDVKLVFSASKNETPKTSSKESSDQKITITGKITNITKAKKYFAKNSHLVLCNIDTGFRTTIGLSGSFEVEDSSLPKTSISEKGTFTFQLESLDPGQYIIFLQPVLGFTTGKYSMALVVDEKTDKRVEIKYPQENSSSKKIDLKNVLLNTP
jgi:hypothetical protein